jgi:acetylornithine deacetylase
VKQQVKAWTEHNRELILETLRDLVRIDTQNLAPNGNERAGQMSVASLLRHLGCTVDVFEPTSVPGLTEHPAYWDQRSCSGRPNVVGIRKGTGGGRSLLFSSHMDTVPKGPDPWTVAPWEGEVRGGRLYGLGAYDMKAGLAASILVVRALNDLGITLKGDLLVESVVDEEFGGANGTLAARLKYNADVAIVGEPTNLAVCHAHHGGLMLRVTFRGKAGWGFSPEKPKDPVAAVGRFITLVNDWAAHRKAVVKVPAPYALEPDLPVLINQVKAGDVALPFFADRVPSHAWLAVWIECFPGTSAEEIIADLRAFYRDRQAADPVLAEAEPEFQAIRFLDGSEIPADHPMVQALSETVSDVLGRPAVVKGAPFACDGHMFNLHSPTPVTFLGPTGGNPHSPDEFIDIAEFYKLVEIYVLTALRWCGAD